MSMTGMLSVRMNSAASSSQAATMPGRRNASRMRVKVVHQEAPDRRTENRQEARGEDQGDAEPHVDEHVEQEEPEGGPAPGAQHDHLWPIALARDGGIGAAAEQAPLERDQQHRQRDEPDPER